jgi:hypothetical protein
MGTWKRTAMVAIAIAATFRQAWCSALVPAGDALLVADTENHCIRRYDPPSGAIATVAGVPTEKGRGVGGGLRTTHLSRPHGCCIAPDGRLVIADSDNDRILAGAVEE